ncbi:MAG: DUF262 domain-containing protein [Negativicoccus succinicivorans]|uniref:GmrSD restriction endonuclease domain-containing protein n=1 Tax=Negativicoccus succinicivorans TaxID=620903 RepID=UPI00050DCDB4|nr:DUF262 domain-containing protein [Negativicoccus succinicivorans]KGF11746.1 hypothetical protein HMPREF1633_04235 [Tissierellia bacterium S5-A11]MDU1056199.1 DUF262 domain-containing protein [Negativicoccus succinicivorans]MDU4202926.1 DUF262 domain-containing protein [Negativicoccus succinicivorans]MDU5395545.1 DUF262 domain-containing protein [Negativicoccus succinicivorans]
MNSKFQPPVRSGLLDFLKNSNGCQFVIPVYQRNYTWTAKKEVKQYLDDLKSVLIGEYSNHFLGIIIYMDTPLDFATREFSVIDGQQRLTTTFLILYAIKAIMKEKEATDAINNLEGQFLTNPFASNDRIKYKLKPLVADDDVYQFIVKDKVDQIENKESKIYKNYTYILDYIRDLNKSHDYNQILLALNELYVVCIPLSSDDNAQKIFESINATGVKLTASDLIRNFLLMDLDSEKQEKYYRDYWMKLEKYLSDDARKLENFFRFYLASKNKILPNKNAVYKEFVNWYKNQEHVLGREGIFKDVIKYARYYFEIYRKDINRLAKELRGSISEFRKILSDMPAPLLMFFYDLYDNDKITASQLSKLIYVVNNYLIRRALCGIDTSNITRLFAPVLKDVEEDCKGNYDNIVDILKKNLVFKNINNGMYVPDDKQLHDMVVNSNMYKIPSPIRIFFDKLEHENNPAPVNLEELNIEHLMPQTPTKEWYEYLKVDEETYQRNVNRLGNLTLAAKVDNSKMQNKVWDYKNEILSSTSHLTINQSILDKEKWDIEEIDRRTNFLIEEINRIFPYPRANEDVLRVEEIFITNNGIKASANFYIDSGDVEILEGSELYDFSNAENYPEIEELRQELVDEGIIFDNGQKMVFKKSFMVNTKTKSRSALSSSASLILHGSRNGWEYWTNAEGKPLKQVQEVAKHFNVCE